MKKKMMLAVLAVSLALCSSAAFAATTYELGFKQQKAVDCNNADNCALGESLLGLDVTDNMDGTVTFKFSIEDDMDMSTDGGSIKKIAFGGTNTLFDGVNSTSSMGTVNYVDGGTNASPVPFLADLVYNASAPPPVNGVNVGEMDNVVCDLGPRTIKDGLDAFDNGDMSNGVRVSSK